MFISNDFFIDLVQNGKKSLVNTLVTHKPAQALMIELIDKQTTMVKDTSNLVFSTMAKFNEHAIQTVTDLSKIDWSPAFPVAK